jgi:hypothetical protein
MLTSPISKFFYATVNGDRERKKEIVNNSCPGSCSTRQALPWVQMGAQAASKSAGVAQEAELKRENFRRKSVRTALDDGQNRMDWAVHGSGKAERLHCGV